jgi:hypothetical protein
MEMVPVKPQMLVVLVARAVEIAVQEKELGEARPAV